MSLSDKLRNPSLPVTFFEVVPPAADKPLAVESLMQELDGVRHLADAVNLPEIRDEGRGARPTAEFVERLDARVLGARIVRELKTEVVVNHVVVHEPDPVTWFRETHGKFGISHVVLVGGESSKVRYPGPSVLEAAKHVKASGLPVQVGGVTIPSRVNEAERIRRKTEAGLAFFTTQVLFDSNDIVWLIQRLNGLEARMFLSFAPVSHARDVAFLRWLGADIPRDLDRFLLGGDLLQASQAGKPAPSAPEEKERLAAARQTCLERSLDLSQRILLDVFDNLPPDPPPIGLNIEHINRRNVPGAMKMLDRLGRLYASLVAARARSTLA